MRLRADTSPAFDHYNIMGKPLQSKTLSPTLSLTQYGSGWSLWDTTRGCNITMYASGEQAALVDGLH